MLDKVARFDKTLGERDETMSGARLKGALPLSDTVEASLHFARGGGRTVLTRQQVPYPFHATRTFYLDRERPEIATLYLQSASGGLYRGDGLALSIEVGAAATAHVTTQASTIVHNTQGHGAKQHIRMRIAANAFAALTPDPLVLFPGAEISTSTEVTLGAGANAIVTEALAHHDPEGKGRPFARYSNVMVVRDLEGNVLVSDRGSVAGELTSGRTSPLGPFASVGALFVLGVGPEQCDPKVLEDRIAACGCLAGISRLPNHAGVGGRILAANGGVLARGLETGFAAAFEAIVGVPPARRRK